MLCHSWNFYLRDTSHLGCLLFHPHHVQVRVWTTIIYFGMLYFLWLGTSIGKSGRVTFKTKKCKVWKSFSVSEDRVNRLTFACSPLAHFFFDILHSMKQKGRIMSSGFFFSFHSKDLKILEADAAWDPCNSSLAPELHLSHSFCFSRAGFSSQAWGLSPVAHSHQCCSHTM